MAPIALPHRKPREEAIRLLRDVSGRERHDTGGRGGSTDPVTGNNPVTG